MANPTMTLIASNTVGSGGASSVSFTSIPATWTDLLIKFSVRSTVSALVEGINVSLNGTGTYTFRRLYGSGTSASSDTSSVPNFITGNTATSSTFGSAEIYLPNYAGSNQKSYSTDMVTENNGTNAYAGFVAGLWSLSSAVTSLTFTPETATSFVQYSTFYLYGINNS